MGRDMTNTAINGVVLRKKGLVVAGMAATFALTMCAGQGAVAYGASAVDEQEPNDSFETANVIKMNQTVYGQTDEDGYQYDYYKVVLPVNGTVKITWENDARTESGDRLCATVYDGTCNELNSWDTKTNLLGSSTEYIGLKRGINYISINGWWGYYNAPYHFKLTYVVGGTNVTKLTPSKKAFSTSWVKKSGAASYQVRYTPKSTYKLYDWDQAVKTTISSKSGSAKIRGLKSKTSYYVQVRVAKTIDGETYYSSWTPKKTVTTK